ncbi:hypothetical protein CHS0354_009059 [Potamilus streckersoni]|uniref:Uncharacterized protein n=1 Tax=Potamilus streckersoni TaxID=2493646 RepID=A0AAE0WCU4_9BIVA|nr:hypothetical protein CHS0354_009059 [Potamilus streckersoni]
MSQVDIKYFRATEIRVFPRGRLHLDEEVERGKRCNRHSSRTRNQYSDSKSGHRNVNVSEWR